MNCECETKEEAIRSWVDSQRRQADQIVNEEVADERRTWCTY